MRLYVESNFLYSATDALDAHFPDCKKLLDFAEKGEIDLMIPRMALFEATPRSTWRSSMEMLNSFEKAIRWIEAP